MKVLGLSGSMRKDGNTAQLIKVILKRCADAGIETEFVSLAGKKIYPAWAARLCKEKKWCAQEKDDWGAIMQKVVESDVLVIGSPTYYYDVCGHLKNFIDRSYSLYHDRKLAGRKGSLSRCRRQQGASRTIQTLEGFLNTHEFSSLGSVKGTGYDEGDCAERSRGHSKSPEDRG